VHLTAWGISCQSQSVFESCDLNRLICTDRKTYVIDSLWPSPRTAVRGPFIICGHYLYISYGQPIWLAIGEHY
jgi:hypothetical protein